MSLIVPKHMAMASSIKKSSVHAMNSDDFVTPNEVASQLQVLGEYIHQRREEVQKDYALPKPTGWKIMVLMLTIPEKSSGGVIVVDDAKEQRSLASPQGVVLAVGPAAYQDADRFSDGHGNLAPWVEAGDRITLVKYDASMFQIANGQRLGFINDTQPIAVIDKGWEVPS